MSSSTFREEWQQMHTETTAELKEVDAEVQDITNKLEELKKQESELKKRTEDLQAKKDKLLARIAPITRVEPELLARIFEATLLGRSVADLLNAENGDIDRLGLVCQRWRTVIFSWPSLWREVGIDYFRHDSSMTNVRRAKTYFQRSGICPIRFALRINEHFYTAEGENPPSRSDVVKQLMDNIALPIDRCEEVNIYCERQDMDVIIKWMGDRRQQPKALPAVEGESRADAGAVVESNLLSRIKTMKLHGAFPDLSAFTNLETLTVDKAVLDGWVGDTSIPTTIKNLKLLNTSSIPFKQFISWLNRSQLEYLELNESGWPTNDRILLIEEPGSVMENLHTLILSFGDDRNTQSFLESIDAPNLKVLQLKGGYIPRIDIEQTYRTDGHLLGLGNVSTLRLRGFDITNLEMRDFFVLLKAFPRLQRLEFIKMTVDVGLFDVWRKVAHPKLCPLLEEISWKDKSSMSTGNLSTAEGQELFVKFVESKRNAGSNVKPLKIVELHGLQLEDAILDRLMSDDVKVLK